MTQRLRISAIRFLNPAPLMWDFEHPPEMYRLTDRYKVHLSTPAACATELANGTADIGLVPTAALAATPDLAVLPGCTIASLDRIRSIILVIRRPGGIRSVRRVAADTASRTSNAYAQIIFRKFLGMAPEFIPHAPNLETMLDRCDAAVLIGDPALLALEDREARLSRTGQQLEYLDLGSEWKRYTGVPWVSAVWGVRPQAVTATKIQPDQIVHDFTQSRDHGLDHREDLVREWAARIAVPAATIRTYLSENIHYVLDDACIAGMELFFRYGAECSVLPSAAPIRWLR